MSSREEEDKVKQEYKKPQVVKVSLKVEQTVLAACKVEASLGPYVLDCALGTEPCLELGQFS